MSTTTCVNTPVWSTSGERRSVRDSFGFVTPPVSFTYIGFLLMSEGFTFEICRTEKLGINFFRQEQKRDEGKGGTSV